MQCPKCTALMLKETFGGEEIDVCTGCGGLWFDAGELDRLKAMPGSHIVDEGSAKVGKIYNKVDRIACPRCTTPMIRMVDPQQPHIWLESCKVCYGVFLDAGEFRDLKRHTLIDWFRDVVAKERK